MLSPTSLATAPATSAPAVAGSPSANHRTAAPCCCSAAAAHQGFCRCRSAPLETCPLATPSTGQPPTSGVLQPPATAGSSLLRRRTATPQPLFQPPAAPSAALGHCSASNCCCRNFDATRPAAPRRQRAFRPLNFDKFTSDSDCRKDTEHHLVHACGTGVSSCEESPNAVSLSFGQGNDRNDLIADHPSWKSKPNLECAHPSSLETATKFSNHSLQTTGDATLCADDSSCKSE
ncbi:hypothetical protein ZIOFF_073714 [Zingiber officinale]|uniref:Uncharacterized protein n=1 Tax=Zingiber officinale TaxID=94328 RepID=A0A8J5ETV1_ZINOF|nr:hypothetical protein ZIOFF_073714 [Zingiber officinale]